MIFLYTEVNLVYISRILLGEREKVRNLFANLIGSPKFLYKFNLNLSKTIGILVCVNILCSSFSIKDLLHDHAIFKHLLQVQLNFIFSFTLTMKQENYLKILIFNMSGLLSLL